MKPDWDKLMGEFKGHKSILVADVDCTAGGEALCEKVGVEGYPTLKWGDAGNMEDYEGERDLDTLQEFARNLKPVCSPSALENCDEEGKKKIEEIMAFSEEDLKSKIEGGEKEIADAEKNFEEELEKLQAQYESLSKSKDTTVATVKKSGLSMWKAVLAHKESGAGDKKEL